MSTSTHIPPPGERLNGQRLVRLNSGTVERAGTCLDGDDCPRWHCRACGRYWLGSAAHSCDSPVPGLEQKICAWMQEALEQDKDVATCMRKVLLLVKAAGLGEALLDAYGDRLIALVWREFRDDDDEDDDDVDDVDKKVANGGAGASVNAVAVNGVSEASSDRLQIATVADNHAAARAEPAPAPRGVRWMDVEQLATEAALLECLYQVDAKWIRLGDLNKRQCRVLQRQHGAAADAFGQLAAGLADGQIVRQRWTADQLEDLVGDTLRAAAPARPIST